MAVKFPAILLLVVLLLGCAKNVPGDTQPNLDGTSEGKCSYLSEKDGDPQNFEHVQFSVAAADTDPNIDLVPEKDHLVMWRKNYELRPELFVWIGGTDTKPQSYSTIQRVAAFAGYKTVNLAYYNVGAVSKLCNGEPEPCTEDIRNERLYGIDATEIDNVDEANSMVNRLLKLLEHLNEEHPDGGWDAYYNNGELDWSKIIVAGHSQGGSFSLYISKNHNVARAITFSNPGDYEFIEETETFLGYNDWTKEPRVTPPENLYAVYHENEGSAPIFPQKATEYGLDRFGLGVHVEESSPPYGCSHVLIVSEMRDNHKNAHTAVATDAGIPVDSRGIPLNVAAYLYLMTVEPT